MISSYFNQDKSPLFFEKHLEGDFNKHVNAVDVTTSKRRETK